MTSLCHALLLVSDVTKMIQTCVTSRVSTDQGKRGEKKNQISLQGKVRELKKKSTLHVQIHENWLEFISEQFIILWLLGLMWPPEP